MSLTNSELAPESAQDDFATHRHADATLRLDVRHYDPTSGG